MFIHTLKTRFRDFCRDDDGSYTVEIVLWFPALLIAFQFVTDATVSLLYQQNFYDTARDASRMVALGQRSTEEAQAWIVEELDHIADLDASVIIDNNFVTSSIEAPLGNIASLSGRFGGRTLSANVSMWIENFEG